MAQRGRKPSATIVALSAATDMPPRRTAPSFLSNAERSLFTEIIEGTDPRHFVAGDLPLLTSYVKVSLLVRDAPSDLSDAEALTAWQRAVRLQTLLATKLRLTPQTRSDPKTVAREQRQGPQPWEIVRDVKVVKTVDEEL